MISDFQHNLNEFTTNDKEKSDELDLENSSFTNTAPIVNKQKVTFEEEKKTRFSLPKEDRGEFKNIGPSLNFGKKEQKSDEKRKEVTIEEEFKIHMNDSPPHKRSQSVEMPMSNSVELSREIYEEMDKEFKCPICKEIFTKPIWLPCQHVFCEVCLKEQVKREKITKGNPKCAECGMQFSHRSTSYGNKRFNRLLESWRKIRLQNNLCTQIPTSFAVFNPQALIENFRRQRAQQEAISEEDDHESRDGLDSLDSDTDEFQIKTGNDRQVSQSLNRGRQRNQDMQLSFGKSQESENPEQKMTNKTIKARSKTVQPSAIAPKIKPATAPKKRGRPYGSQNKLKSAKVVIKKEESKSVKTKSVKSVADGKKVAQRRVVKTQKRTLQQFTQENKINVNSQQVLMKTKDKLIKPKLSQDKYSLVKSGLSYDHQKKFDNLCRNFPFASKSNELQINRDSKQIQVLVVSSKALLPNVPKVLHALAFNVPIIDFQWINDNLNLSSSSALISPFQSQYQHSYEERTDFSTLFEGFGFMVDQTFDFPNSLSLDFYKQLVIQCGGSVLSRHFNPKYTKSKFTAVLKVAIKPDFNRQAIDIRLLEATSQSQTQRNKITLDNKSAKKGQLIDFRWAVDCIHSQKVVPMEIYLL